MNSKHFTILVFFVVCVTLLIAAYLLNSLSRNSAFQATLDYAISGHADKESIAFTYWNDNTPAVIPATCTRCHSASGFLEFVGDDGSQPGAVFKNLSVGEVITCTVCHNPTIYSIESVRFHSGVQYQPVGSETSCLICHQTRQSGVGIQLELGFLDADQVAERLSFINPHYNFAASTQSGGLVGSGFEYPDHDYAGFFSHAYGAETCTECHNPHSLEVDPQLCASCHTNVVTDLDFHNIRVQIVDFDGDGITSGGIISEIIGLQDVLLSVIQGYALNVNQKPIIWADTFPYFFVDVNGNRTVESEEISFTNRYTNWTPRLIRAAYNYQFSKKDPGGYVHNPRYVLQLLHDSINDLATPAGIQLRDLPRP